jgi:hypothetical protein
VRGGLIVRPLLAPLAVSALGVGFVVQVAWHTVELDPLPIARAPNMVADAIPVSRTTGAVDVTPAVELDPFRPERRRAPARYPVPGDAPPRLEKPPETAPSAVTLVGTVMSLDGSGFAMVAIAGSPSRVVRVGQTVGELMLKKIEQGKAVFRSATGELVVLTVPKAGQ